jgi:hypothetical protein
MKILSQEGQYCRQLSRRRRRHSRCRYALAVVIGHPLALGLAKMRQSLVSPINNARKGALAADFSAFRPKWPIWPD